MTAAERFARLPTAAKLLFILTAVLLPIGIALVWLGESGIRQANEALKGRAEDQSRAAAESMEGLLARDALALRVAANGALAGGTGDACARALRSLTIAPGVAQSSNWKPAMRSRSARRERSATWAACRWLHRAASFFASRPALMV